MTWLPLPCEQAETGEFGLRHYGVEWSLGGITVVNESAQPVASALVAGKLGHLSQPVWKREKGKGVLIGRSKSELSL